MATISENWCMATLYTQYTFDTFDKWGPTMLCNRIEIIFRCFYGQKSWSLKQLEKWNIKFKRKTDIPNWCQLLRLHLRLLVTRFMVGAIWLGWHNMWHSWWLAMSSTRSSHDKKLRKISVHYVYVFKIKIVWYADRYNTRYYSNANIVQSLSNSLQIVYHISKI